ncbi:hypothetical protein HRR83_005282 [Exophiala dermatitidis]|nr:hypothetical protein HRR74_005134 [Exophiala dermatitidis]KAJ4571481.1 hypothetical protein HRR81_005512 [Exophiala dermatitidis]KAJ4577867.1 hypothetical protein HRR79_001193 [Exophiala dermatitidis]KAJ4585671.1 hypothetical protein HRR82_002734 [Exophiala dermatitidis]KAJ4594099.1 hypothetical protein HRR84_006210 [Exophiala dermatitidis]
MLQSSRIMHSTKGSNLYASVLVLSTSYKGDSFHETNLIHNSKSALHPQVHYQFLNLPRGPTSTTLQLHYIDLVYNLLPFQQLPALFTNNRPSRDLQEQRPYLVMATTKVAIAGATGNLGLPILNKVLSAGYPVTVLTRKGSSNTSKLPQNSAITIREVDYSDVASLTSALQGINVVVSVLATAVVGGQTPLIEAAVAAGVSRFIPSEFGSNTVNPNAAQLPVFKGKVETLGVLKSKVQSNPGSFSYTQIINGPFFDWGLEHGFIINPAKHTADIYNGGDVYFSTTTLDTIGDAVVGVIRNLDKTANRPLYIQDARVTQNQLIQYAKEKDGKEWSITHKDTNKVREESFNELKKGSDGNIGAAMVGFILSAIFDPEYGSDFEGSLDNDLLGIKGYSDDEVRKLVERFL